MSINTLEDTSIALYSSLLCIFMNLSLVTFPAFISNETAIVNISIIVLFAIPVLITWNNKNIVKPIIASPINTHIVELMLCFTTSVSFLASILGYFKFIIMPIVSDISGNKTDVISISNIFNILNLNFINISISPIKMHGIIISTAVNTLVFTIVVGFTGRLFKILNDLPSNDIIELVIDVIKLVKQMNPNNSVGI